MVNLGDVHGFCGSLSDNFGNLEFNLICQNLWNILLILYTLLLHRRYNVAGTELTAEEKIELASKVKVINPTATQLYENPFEDPAASSSKNTKFFKGLPGM